MRVLVVGDTHADTSFVLNRIDNALDLDCDAILQLGDFGIGFGYNFLDDVERSLIQAQLKLYFIPGNHENYSELLAFEESGKLDIRPHIHYFPKGSRWTWDGVKFGTIGGAFSVDFRRRVAGLDLWPDFEEAHTEDMFKLGSEKLNIFVCHDTPYVDDRLRMYIVGPEIETASERTRKILQQAVLTTEPEIVFHGHWHRRLTYNWHGAKIEALGANVGGGSSWGVLKLPSMKFTDSTQIGNR